MTFAHSLWRMAARWPDRRALRYGEREWTFDEMWRASGTPAAALRAAGVAPGDRVGLLIANQPEWLFWCLAVSRLGGIIVPINPAYTASEVQALLSVAELRVLIKDDVVAEALAGNVLQLARGVILSSDLRLAPRSVDDDWSPLVPEDSTEPTIIYFSSGTTGEPKGIVHSSRNLCRIADLVRKTWQIGEDDAVLIAMPLAFVYSSTVAWLSAIRAGAHIVLQHRFDPHEVVRLIDAGQLSVLMGVPRMYRMLLEVPRDGAATRNRLKSCLTAGDVLPPALDQQFRKAFSQPLFDFYGMSEAPHIVSHVPGQDVCSRPFSCGRPLEGVEVRIVDDAGRPLPVGEVGELICSTPFTFLRYVARDVTLTEQVLKQGWLRTGDMMRQDTDGYLYMIERKKELIKRSGFNVLPGEVEVVIQAMDGVVEVAVVGIPDEVYGEQVKAFVVSAADALIDADVVLARCRRELANYKVPDEVEFISALPRGATGKIMKKYLRECEMEKKGVGRGGTR